MKSLFIAILMAIMPLFASAQVCDVSSVQDGLWTSPSTWDNGDGQDCSINQQQLIICIYHNVTINCANFDLRGGVEIYLMTPGITLTINGNLQMRGTSISGFANGTNVVVNGDVEMLGNSEVDLDGNMHVSGDVTVDASAVFCGDGILTADGTISGVCGGLLPVEFAEIGGDLTAKGIDISWATVSESNNDFFTVERSFNGTDFDGIATISAAGNSTEYLRYSFSDNSGFNNMDYVYYRIRQTDFDGSFTLSKVLAFNVEKLNSETNIKLFPNPAKDAFTLQFESNNAEADLLIYNSVGQLVFNLTVYPKNERKDINFDISDWDAGFYTVVIRNGEQIIQQKLVVQ